MSNARILADLRLAGKHGDRAALTLAVDGMRLLAHSPRYWSKYLVLLRNPVARLVDLLVVKQGEKIAQLRSRRAASSPSEPAARKGRRQTVRSKRTPSRGGPSTSQPALFE